MNKKLLRYSIRSVLLMMLVSAVWAASHQPREIKVTMEPVSVDVDQKTATVSLKNSGRNSIFFSGYSLSSPSFTVDEQINGIWTPLQFGRCGTGLGLRRLGRNRATEFNVFWSNNATAIRVRVNCSTKRDYKTRREIVSPPMIVATSK